MVKNDNYRKIFNKNENMIVIIFKNDDFDMNNPF